MRASIVSLDSPIRLPRKYLLFIYSHQRPPGGDALRRLAVAAYAARSVLRRRLGTTSALIGLALGVAVASAPWVAIDSTLRGLTESSLGRVPIDFAASGSGYPERNAWNASQSASRVPYVVQAEPILFLGLSLNRSGDVQYVTANWIRPTFAEATARMGITWSARPAAGGVVVPDSLRLTGLAVGDTVSLEYGVWTLPRRIDGFYNVTPNAAFSIAALFLPESDVPDAKSALNQSSDLPAVLFVWLDRGALVNSFDPEGTAARLLRERTLLQDALQPHGFYLGYAGIEVEVQSLAAQVRLLRLLFLPITIPTIAMAILLSRVGFDIGLTGRRRELAVLRARGLSVRAVHGFLLVEITVVSLLAAAAGLGIALVLSRIFLTLPMFRASYLGGNPTTPVAEVAVTPTTLVFVLGFAWALGWIASRRALKFALSKDIVSTFRAYHAEEVSIPHRASRDFLLAAIGIAGLLLLLSSGLLGADLVALLVLPTAVLGSAAPIILAVGLGRYLTRGTTRAYRALARLFRGLLGDLEALVDKNIARAPRRASNITMIVTFAVAFVVAMAVFSASSDAFLTDEARRMTPSDIVVRVVTSGAQFHSSGWAEVRSIPGVAEVTPLLKTSVEDRSAWVFDARTYLRTVPWLEPRHLGGVDPHQLMDALSQGNSVAVNSRFQAVTGLVVGDPVTILLRSRDRQNVTTITLRLAAVVPFLPGSDDSPYSPQVFFDFSALPSSPTVDVDASWFLLVALQAGTDPAAVVSALDDLFGERALITTLQDAIRAALENPVRTGAFAYLATQSQIATVLLVLGIGLLVYSAASGRRNELVTLVARGLPRNRVARLVMAEGWIVALLGILLGTLTGLLAAASVLGVVSTRIPFPVPFVVPWTAILPVLVVTAGVWAASFLGALSIQRMDVARVLKSRGG